PAVAATAVHIGTPTSRTRSSARLTEFAFRTAQSRFLPQFARPQADMPPDGIPPTERREQMRGRRKLAVAAGVLVTVTGAAPASSPPAAPAPTRSPAT